MSNYLNLEKPKETDLNWGDSLNRNTDKIDIECSRLNTELGNKAPNSHTHTIYALTGHTHSELSSLASRVSVLEGRVNTLFSDKADKSYVVQMLQNFDVSVANLTPSVSISGQGNNSSSVKVNCFINSNAFLLEWSLTYQWNRVSSSSAMGPQNTSEFRISKPGSTNQAWGNTNQTGITIKIKCRNPFLVNNWSKEVTITDNEIYMYNFIDIDKLITAVTTSANFQNTVASSITANPSLTEKLVANVKATQNQTQSSGA